MAKKYEELLKYNLIFEGTLKKSPPQKTKAFFNFITKRWRNRHFVLYKTNYPNAVYLVYFKTEPTPDCKSIGEINLVNLKNISVDVGSTVNRANVFSIHTLDDKSNDRIYYLCAQSCGLMQMWVNHIVSSLNLNTQCSNYSTISTIYSPTIYSPQNHESQMISPSLMPTSKVDSAIWSSPTSPNCSRKFFPSSNESSSDKAESSYYNLSPNQTPLLKDLLEDPISIEEDVYKYPNENNAYVNLGDAASTPTTTENVSNILFPSNDNLLSQRSDATTSTTSGCKDTKHISDYLACCSFPDDPSDKQVPYKPPFNHNTIDVDVCDWDYSLPTRVRRDSECSDSSSSCTSSDDDTHTRQMPLRMESNEPHSISCESPPRVPKRLNLHEINNPSMTCTSTETVLPIKTPKSVLSKNETSFSGGNEESFAGLHYLDAENLLLEGRKPSGNDNIRDSTYSSLLSFPNSYGNFPFTTSELMRHDTPVNYSAEEFSSSSLPPVVKDVKPSVEYREICDTRTEAVRKLNVRILNNE